MNTLSTAPIVEVFGRKEPRRRSIDELLDEARIDAHEWWFKFDERSHLHIAGAADFLVVVELIATAPSERLAGYVEGLYVNN